MDTPHGRAALLLASIVGAAWLGVVWLWDVAPIALTVDDAFYYFQTARHIAAGDGATFDGLGSTNGFHPLWMACLVPIAGALREHGDLFVRVVLTLQLGLVAWGTAVLGRAGAGVARTARVVSLLATNFWFLKVFVNGLEAACEYALLAVSLSLAQRALVEADDARRARLVVWLGAAAAGVTLARLSSVVFGVLLFGALVGRVRPHLRTTAAGVLAFAAPVALYATYNFAKFGHVVPIHAAIKLARPTTPSLAAIAIAAAASAILAGLLWLERARAARAPLWLLPLAGTVLVQCAADAVLRNVFVPEIWYLVPHATLAIMIAAFLLQRLGVRARAPATALACAVALSSLYVAHVRRDPTSYSGYVVARRAGEWIASHTPPNARVAGWSAGITAFYSNRTFANLDGLIGSWHYKERYLDRGLVRQYLDDARIDFIADYVPAGDAFGPALADWKVVHEEVYEFRGILDAFRSPSRFRFVVLERP